MTNTRRFTLFLLMMLLGIITHGCGRGFSGSGGSLSSMNIHFTNCLPVCSGGFQMPCYVERIFSDWDSSPPKVYHERVWFDSGNSYRIECTGIWEEQRGSGLQPCPQSEVDTYNNLLEGGQGYFAVFNRGFKITDPDLFLENYNYSILNPDTRFLGRDAVLIEIVSKQQDRPNYTVWIDRELGLVLKYIQSTLVKDPLTIMEVTGLDLDPDFTGIEMFNRNVQENTISMQELDVFGFPLFQPIYVPPGFYAEDPVKVDLSGQTIFKQSYTDGIETIVIQQYCLDGMQAKKSHQIGGGSVPQQDSPIDFSTFAGLSIVHFKLLSIDCVIKAHLHEDELGAMIQSFSQIH